MKMINNLSDQGLKSRIKFLSKQKEFLSGGISNQKIKKRIKKRSIAALSWSGGKDCCLLLQKAIEKGFKIKYLFNLFYKDIGLNISPPYNKRLIELQSQALGIPIRHIDISGDSRKKFKEFVQSIEEECIDVLGMGYIDLKGQREFVQEAVADTKIQLFEPNVGRNQHKMLLEILRNNIKPMIVSVENTKVDNDYLGKIIDHDFLKYLNKTNLAEYCGEKGEYQTLIIDCPLFKKKLKVKEFKVIKVDTFFHLFIQKATLLKK